MSSYSDRSSAMPDETIPIKHCPCCKFYVPGEQRPLHELLAVFDPHGPIRRKPRPVDSDTFAAHRVSHQSGCESYESEADIDDRLSESMFSEVLSDLSFDLMTTSGPSTKIPRPTRTPPTSIISDEPSPDADPDYVKYDFNINRSSHFKQNRDVFVQLIQATANSPGQAAPANPVMAEKCSKYDHQRAIFEQLVEASATNSGTIKRRGSRKASTLSTLSSELENEVFEPRLTDDSIQTEQSDTGRSRQLIMRFENYRLSQIQSYAREMEAPNEPVGFQVPVVDLRHVASAADVYNSNVQDNDDDGQMQTKSIDSLVHMFEERGASRPDKPVVVNVISKPESIRDPHDEIEIETKVDDTSEVVQMGVAEDLAEQMSAELVMVRKESDLWSSPASSNNLGKLCASSTKVVASLILPSVVPLKNFRVLEDVAALRKAMKGFGTDEHTLIEIICRRTNAELKEIQCKYTIQLGRDLYKDVRSETSGNFREVLCALLLPRQLFYVNQLHVAMHGMVTDEKALVEIMCALSHAELAGVQATYISIYNRSLEADITEHTSGMFSRLLVAMCVVKRDEGAVDQMLVRKDAVDMIAWPIKLRANVDDCLFNQILTQRSFAHIRAINQFCLDSDEGALVDIILNQFNGALQTALSAIVKLALDQPYFFATRLYKSMAGLGTTDSQLIRVMVMRCEIDLAAVAVVFERVYGQTLESFIRGDTSGDYRKALLTLLGKCNDESMPKQ